MESKIKVQKELFPIPAVLIVCESFLIWYRRSVFVYFLLVSGNGDLVIILYYFQNIPCIPTNSFDANSLCPWFSLTMEMPKYHIVQFTELNLELKLFFKFLLIFLTLECCSFYTHWTSKYYKFNYFFISYSLEQ